MKTTSLARRIFRIIFTIGMINVVVTLIATEIIYEDVESTILSLELAEERRFLEEKIDGSRVQAWETALLKGVFVPDGMTSEHFPEIFSGRSAPLSAEVEIGPKTYLISIEKAASANGVLYLAQDISILEDREDVVQLTIIFLGITMLLIGLLLARQGTNRLVQPLLMLSREIAKIHPGATLHRIESTYSDLELAEIARTLNELLGALDQYVKREKALVSLASHELRTPLAVIAGALDVLEQRGLLGEADRRTTARIRRAADEMRSDVEALLKLARRSDHGEDPAPIELGQCIAEVVADIAAAQPEGAHRITIRPAAAALHMLAEPALVRMLLRNLIQNAVRHTRGEVEVTLDVDHLRIRDHGSGLPAYAQSRLGEPSAQQPVPEDGLGLFIVRLICERLDWHIATHGSEGGTVIELRFATPAEAAPGDL